MLSRTAAPISTPLPQGIPRGSRLPLGRRSLLWLNVVGGLGVLASYAYGLVANPVEREALWGGLPAGLRPLYTLSMLLAAAGYFAFSRFVFFHLDPQTTRIGEHLRFGVFHGLYALILVPSALWMPLTFALLAGPSPLLWWAIRLSLASVAIGSTGLVAALLTLRPQESRGAWRLAVIGCTAFWFQTAVLDALVWPAFFRF